MLSSYRFAVLIIGIAVGLNTVAIFSMDFLSPLEAAYLAAAPILYLIMGAWYHSEWQMDLFRKALGSLVRSKAAKTELSSQQDK